MIQRHPDCSCQRSGERRKPRGEEMVAAAPWGVKVPSRHFPTKRQEKRKRKRERERERGRVDRIRGRQKEDMEERAAREKEREWGRD